MAYQFVRNEMRPYYTTRKIHLGAWSLDISEGTVFLYDGVILQHDGENYSVPQLKAFLNVCFVPEEDAEVEAPVAKPAPVVAAPTTSDDSQWKFKGKAVAEEDERVVKVVKGRAVPEVPEVQTAPAPFNRSVSASDSAQGKTLTPRTKKATTTPTPTAGVNPDVEAHNLKVISELHAKPAPRNIETQLVSTKKSGFNPEVLRPDAEGTVVKSIASGENSAAVGSDAQAKAVPILATTSISRIENFAEARNNAPALARAKTASAPDPVKIAGEWNTDSGHWQTRVKAAIGLYKDHPEVLAAICEKEQPGFVKAVKQFIK